MSAEHFMPQSVEAEEAVLAGILCGDREALESALEALTPSHFWLSRTRIVWEVVCGMASRGEPVDLMTVTEKLTSIGKLDQCGGASTLSRIAVLVSAHSDYFAGVLEEKMRLRRIIEVGTAAVRGAYETDQSSETLVTGIEANLLRLGEKERAENDGLQDCHLALMAEVERVRGKKPLGLATGVPVLDEDLLGWMPGTMTVIGAEGGAGKSSLVEQSAMSLIERGEPVLVIPKDMSKALFWKRMCCRRAGVSIYRFNNGWCSENELERIEAVSPELMALPLVVRDPPSLSGAEIRMMVKKLKRTHGIKVVFIDHIRKLKRVQRTEPDSIAENSSHIRDSANESGIPHVVLNHINREGRKLTRPFSEHMKGSDQLFDDADNVVLLWPAEKKPEKEPGEDQRWKVGVAFDKNRSGPETETAMIFNGTHMRFEAVPEAKPEATP